MTDSISKLRLSRRNLLAGSAALTALSLSGTRLLA